MITQSKAFAVYALFFSLLLAACGATQVISPTVTPTATIANTPQIITAKEPEKAPDGSLYPFPKAFLPSERGNTTGIKQLAIDEAFTNKIFSEAQSQLDIDSENVDIVGFRLMGDKVSTFYILVGDRSNDKFYSAFSTNEYGFYSPISRDGNTAFLPMTRQDRDGETLIGFDVEGDLLLPPTFVYKNGILLFTDPKTGEKVEMSTWEDWAHKVLALLTKDSTRVIEPTAKPTEYHAEDSQLEKVQTLTPEQQKIIEDAQSYIKDRFHMDPNIINITFDKDGKEIDTDTISGRVIAIDDKRTFFDRDNTTGKDQLEDGSWVFNNNFVERLANEGLDKTHLEGNRGIDRNVPSSDVDKYTREITNKMKTDNPGVLEQMVGGFSENETFSRKSVLLYVHTDGTYSWGSLVGKMYKTESWIESKRVIVYKDKNGTIKYTPIYYPNYLIYR
jgi:hypothetical protein